MSELYGAQSSYLNNVKSLTAKEFGDKIDLFYLNLTDATEINSVNVISEGNEELMLDVTFLVPDDTDAQDYANDTIAPLISAAFNSASLSLKSKVAERIEEPVGV